MNVKLLLADFFSNYARFSSPSLCRLSAWWLRRWCRGTKSSSLRGVSQCKSSCSASMIAAGFRWVICGLWLCTRELSSRDDVFLTTTHKRMTTAVGCTCVWKEVHPVCRDPTAEGRFFSTCMRKTCTRFLFPPLNFSVHWIFLSLICDVETKEIVWTQCVNCIH